MSDKANEILKSLQNGSLPNLKTNTNSTNAGVDTSQRGIDRTTFGLQTLNEGANPNQK